MLPFPPQLRTDCLSLVHTAREGTNRAVHHSRCLARIWKAIAAAVGGDIKVLAKDDRLTWFPAHKSYAAVGHLKGSNGVRLSPVDWRANRLVDKLAKLAAGSLQFSEHITKLVPSAEAAAAHAACLLGIVTHSANNFEHTVIGDGGKETVTILRDSVDRPKPTKTQPADQATMLHPAAEPAGTSEQATSATEQPCVKPLRVVRTVQPWKQPSAASLARRADSARLSQRVQDIGSSLRPSGSEPAQLRIEKLRQRVIAKL